MIKIGTWYKYNYLNELASEFMNKYYSPFKIVEIKGNICICKTNKSDFNWEWNKKFINENCHEITDIQAFEESL